MSSSDVRRRLEAMVVEAVSPDGVITATLSRGRRVRLRLLPRGFTAYQPLELEAQLDAVVNAVYTGYREARRDLRERNGLSGPRSSLAATIRAVRSNGTSTGDWVRVTTRGLSQWRFAVADNIVAALSADRFTAEAESAIAAAITEHDRLARLLRGGSGTG